MSSSNSDNSWISSAERRSGKSSGGFCVPTPVVIALGVSVVVWGILVWMKIKFIQNQDGTRNWAKVLAVLIGLAVILVGIAFLYSSRCGKGKKMCFRMPCA